MQAMRYRRKRLKLVKSVVFTFESDRAASKKSCYDTQCLFQTGDSDRRRAVVCSECLVIVLEPASAESKADAAGGEYMSGSNRLRENPGVVQVVVENKRHGLEVSSAGQCETHRGQSLHRPSLAVVLGYGDCVEAHVLNALQLLSPILDISVETRHRREEAKWPGVHFVNCRDVSAATG